MLIIETLEPMLEICDLASFFCCFLRGIPCLRSWKTNEKIMELEIGCMKLKDNKVAVKFSREMLLGYLVPGSTYFL